MLSLKFPRQKIVKGDFLKRYGDFRACVCRQRGFRSRSHINSIIHTRLKNGKSTVWGMGAKFNRYYFEFCTLLQQYQSRIKIREDVWRTQLSTVITALS